MSNTQTLCDCGCDVRGLTRFQLSGYRKNYDKKTINGSDVVDKHLNNNEHVIAFDLGYVDLDLAVRTANELIWETEKKAETIVEWYEIWDCTNDHKVKTICQHTKMQYGNDDGTDWYYCDNCDYLQVS